ncbi:MAG: prepilin-type N-terminal cleavage/methylation domain-containing protein [Dehalococcoidia bacterium]|nr:prepilin-type N-terminal cleavage/methylation domain-containing protein [Dehalococcoidia bacterium]
MGRIRANQKGFTLIELLIAIPIAALVMLAASGAIVQLVHSSRASAQMNAIRQVQMAGTWISRDGLQAETVVIDTDPASELFCSFQWHDFTVTDAPKHTVVYRLIPMNSGGLYELQREVTVGNDTPTSRTVARNLVSAALSGDETSFTLQVTSQWKQKTVTRTYQVTPRPE